MNDGRFTVTVDADLRNLIPGYIQNRRNDAGKLEGALAAGDMEAVAGIGHRMKGTGSSYGFAGITDIGIRLEDAGKKGERDRVLPLVAELRSYLDRVDIAYADPPTTL